ncbi:MAG: efflux RND transporter periplasmic adaptor subunit [Nitrospira sp.]|nr:efflux RND transporter periplasmic adaptor subunit [Nitrospira sp.]
MSSEPLRPLAEVPLADAPAPRKRFRAGLVLSAAIAAIASGAVLWYWLSPSEPPVRYKTALVDRGPITATVTATGTVNPVVSVQVGSQVTGKIKALYVDYNSVVTQGQAIAQIDPDPFQSRANQARASLRNARGALVKAQAALAQRKLELDRIERLHRQKFVAQADLDAAGTNYRDAAAQVEIAEAQIDQAQAALSNAEMDLGYTTIYSPLDGIVVSRNVDVGQTVAASLQAPTLFVIAQDLTKMQVDANVSESDIAGVIEGREAEFTVDAYPNALFKGLVAQIRNAPISIQNVVTYDVVINVNNPDLRLKPGMTANISIVTARQANALRVPNATLRFKPPGVPVDRKKTALWLRDRKGQALAVPIKAGIADLQFTEILEGEVHEGDQAIVGLEESEEAGQKTLPPGFGLGPRIR